MIAQGFAVFGGQAAGGLRQLQIANQLFHIVLQAVADFIGGGGAHPHHFAFVAVGAHQAGFFIAGNAHARHVHFNHAGHQYINAVAVGIGLHNGANLRLAAQ